MGGVGVDGFLFMPEATKCRDRQKYGLKPGALSGLHLAVYEGCNTGNGNPDFGNLLTVTTQLGAKCAMGWTKTLYGGRYADEGQTVAQSPAHIWAETFWLAWAQGIVITDPSPPPGAPPGTGTRPMTAAEAANAALAHLQSPISGIHEKYRPGGGDPLEAPWGNMDSAVFVGDPSVTRNNALGTTQ